MKCHPSRNLSPEANDEWQTLAVAHGVLTDEKKLASYMYVYKHRCFLQQTPPVDSSSLLLPHYVFPVDVYDSWWTWVLGGSKQERLLFFDFIEMRMLHKDSSKRDPS